MTVTGKIQGRESPKTFQFCVDWQLELAAGAVTAMPRPATSRPLDAVPLSSEPTLNRRRMTRDRSC